MSETPRVGSVSGDVRSGTPTDPRIESKIEAIAKALFDRHKGTGSMAVYRCDAIAMLAALAAVDVGDTLKQVGVEYRYVRTIGDEPASPWQFAREGPRNVNPVLWRVESRPVFVRVVSATPNKETHDGAR